MWDKESKPNLDRVEPLLTKSWISQDFGNNLNQLLDEWVYYYLLLPILLLQLLLLLLFRKLALFSFQTLAPCAGGLDQLARMMSCIWDLNDGMTDLSLTTIVK